MNSLQARHIYLLFIRAIEAFFFGMAKDWAPFFVMAANFCALFFCGPDSNHMLGHVLGG